VNDAGYAAVALDHRGHGRTGASSGAGVMGPGGGQAVVDDLHELRLAATDALGADVPVFVFGHSLGSLIALAYITQNHEGLAGAVLCGFPVDVEQTAAMGAVLAALEDQRDQVAANLLSDNNAPFEPARTAYDWLSRDPAEVDRYVADPFCGDGNPLTYGYLIDLFGVVAPARDHLDVIGFPVLVIAGDQDPAAAMGAHPTGLAAALRGAGVDTDLVLYEGARHELLNETNRDEVTADVVVWLESHLPAG
jgi:alpha-beta hydrolase superfamily lysophospholipase